MESIFISLAVCTLCAAITPIIANVIPGKLIPDSVLLLSLGALLGPYGLGIIRFSDPLSLMSELGMAFLFLLAGYEIDPRHITGKQGGRAALTWVVSFAAALALAWVATSSGELDAGIFVIAIALTTTAIGTLMPILAERGVLGTKIGNLVLSYGTYGEIFPIVAIALLLSARSTWVTAGILLLFALIALFVGWRARSFRKTANKVYDFLVDRADSTSQTLVRLTVALLCGLVALSAIFELDIILGAFATGFILRYVAPEGNKSLEQKLEGIGYGFLVPIFFMVSGAGINLQALVAAPGLLMSFILLLIIIRFIPILISLALAKDTRSMPWFDRISVAFYCTTALPLIVAVTNIATGAGMLEEDIASVMVAAGAVTVFLMPALASLCQRVAAARPVDAIREAEHAPGHLQEILYDHLEESKQRLEEERERRHQAVTAYREQRHIRTHTPDSGDVPEQR